MTTKQKSNAEKFKKAVAEAKKLRKKNPKLTHAQAVKQAFAILYKTGKVSGAKKPATKKKTVKKKTAKKPTIKTHKDNKSHNVKINVVSGGIGAMSNLSNLIKEKEKSEIKLKALNENLKKTGDTETKNHFKFWINRYKKYIVGLKKQITEAKKHI